MGKEQKRISAHARLRLPIRTCTCRHRISRAPARFCVNGCYRIIHTRTNTDARVLSPHARVSPYVFVHVCTWSSSLRHKHRLYRFGCLCTPPLNSVFQASNIVISLGSCRSPPWHAMSLCTRLFLSSPRALFTLVHRLFSGNDTKIHRKNLPTVWKCCSVRCTIRLKD